MTRFKYIAMAMLALSAMPAMATDFSLNTEGNGWYPSTQVGNGAYQWQTDTLTPFAFDKTFTFNTTTDSLIKVFLWQSQPGFTFTNVFVNGLSIASNFSPSSNYDFIGSALASAGTVSLRFTGYNTSWSHSFGGYVNATKATITPNTPAVPEPASWAMMIAGLGTVGFAMRRSSQKVSFA